MLIQEIHIAKRKILTALGLWDYIIRQISYLWNSHIVLNGLQNTFQCQNYKQYKGRSTAQLPPLSKFSVVYPILVCFVFSQGTVSDLIMKESGKLQFTLQKFTESRKKVKRNWKVVSISNSPVATETVYSRPCPLGKLIQ